MEAPILPRAKPMSHPPRIPGRSATGRRPIPGPSGWPAFAGTTFMLSLINAGLVGTHIPGGGLLPMVAALAIAYGGVAQFIAGIWEFRTGNTFGAVAFCSYGAFWISFYFIVTVRLGNERADRGVQRARAVPVDVGDLHRVHVHRIAADQRGGRVGVPAAGDHVHRPRRSATRRLPGRTAATNGTIKLGGYIGIVTAIAAWYASFAAVINATFGRTVAPVFPLRR